jgi:hypothetical protein
MALQLEPTWWTKTFDGQDEWSCTDVDHPTHRCLEGPQPPSHRGAVHVPDGGLGDFRAAVAASATLLYLHEIASPRHPVYFACGAANVPERLAREVAVEPLRFLTAVAQELHAVVRPLFPDASPDAFVLCLYEGATDELAADAIRAHIVLPDLVVDDETALFLWRAVVDRFAERFTAVPEEWWAAFFDSTPYASAGGGLRVPFSCGIAPCPDGVCVACAGTGLVHQDQYYGPLAYINAGGEVESTAASDELVAESDDVDYDTIQSFFQDRAWLLDVCAVRIKAGVPATRVCLDGIREPTAQLHLLELRTLAERVGPDRARRLVAQAAKRLGAVKDDLRLVAAINDVEHVCSDVPVIHRVHLRAADPRFKAVATFLPPFCRRYFHVASGDVWVRSVTIVLDTSVGEPLRIVVGVWGPGASRCMNRVVDTCDAVVRRDLDRKHSVWGRPVDDVDGIPGRHTEPSVYYVVDQANTGWVTQKCSDADVQSTRRSARAHGPGTERACCAWPGARRQVPPGLMPVVRNMFYLPDEQLEEACKAAVLRNAARLAARWKGGSVVAVGPTDGYQKWATRVITARKRRKRVPTYDEVFGD